MEKRVEAWWRRFAEDVFPLLVPRSKWRIEVLALEPGSIVLIKYEAKFGRDRFRLGRVFDVRRDRDGLVRTAWVGQRALRRAVREPLDVCRAGLTMRELPVQRLIMILPPQEQPAEVLEGLAGFPPMPNPRGVAGLELPAGQEEEGDLGPAVHLEPQQPAVHLEPQQPVVHLPRAPPAPQGA